MFLILKHMFYIRINFILINQETFINIQKKTLLLIFSRFWRKSTEAAKRKWKLAGKIHSMEPEQLSFAVLFIYNILKNIEEPKTFKYPKSQSISNSLIKLKWE